MTSVSDGNDKLRVDVGEAGELRLVEVHDEELVGRRQFRRFARELAVEVGNVFNGPLSSTDIAVLYEP